MLTMQVVSKAIKFFMKEQFLYMLVKKLNHSFRPEKRFCVKLLGKIVRLPSGHQRRDLKKTYMQCCSIKEGKC